MVWNDFNEPKCQITMQKLYFSIAGVLPLMDLACIDTDHRYGTMHQTIRTDGTEKENPFIRPGLNWRIDHGVFLYPNCVEDAASRKEDWPCTFAIGYDPNKDSDFWEKERLLLPDRFLEHPIGLDWINYVVGDRDFGFLVVVVLPEDTFDLEWSEEIPK